MPRWFEHCRSITGTTYFRIASDVRDPDAVLRIQWRPDASRPLAYLRHLPGPASEQSAPPAFEGDSFAMNDHGDRPARTVNRACVFPHFMKCVGPA